MRSWNRVSFFNFEKEIDHTLFHYIEPQTTQNSAF